MSRKPGQTIFPLRVDYPVGMSGGGGNLRPVDPEIPDLVHAGGGVDDGSVLNESDHKLFESASPSFQDVQILSFLSKYSAGISPPGRGFTVNPLRYADSIRYELQKQLYDMPNRLQNVLPRTFSEDPIQHVFSYVSV